MKNKLVVVIVLYFVLNVLVTYLVTSSVFNPNIVNFNTTLLDTIFSTIGNLAILLLLYILGSIFIKRSKSLCRYLIVITFSLNLFLLVLGYFTRNFKTMMSFYNLTLFRNPNAGFAYQIVIDGLTEVVSSIQILCFIPFVLLLISYLILRKNLLDKTNNRFIVKIILLLISLFSSLSTITYFRYQINKNWPFRSEVVEYGVMTCGIYNYYFAELVIGVDYNEDYYNSIKLDEDNLALYNKDLLDNVNIINQKKYTNKNSSILEGMNLFVIQAEALANFVISYEHNGKLLMPYMNEFIKDENVFYFSNLHTVVGLGNTSDAEFAFNTGYYPTGDLTITWNAYDRLFDIQSLPKMFGDEYISDSYNPTIEGFYAHKYVHENFYGFKRFTGFETFEEKHPYQSNVGLYLHKKWVSDQAILEYALGEAMKTLEDDKNFYVFSQTISPHYPFTDLSKSYKTPKEWIDFGKIEKKFQNYLNQISYNDKILYDFMIKAKEELKDTVFIIYGDHGNSISKSSYEKLFQKKLTDIEFRKLLLEIPVIIYDPSGKINNYIDINRLDREHMQTRTLSQIDLFSTVKSMYNLTSEVTLGVDMFSNEPSFAINSKNLDIIGDGFFYTVKNGDYVLNGINYQEMINIVERIKKFKLANDINLTKKIKEEKRI